MKMFRLKTFASVWISENILLPVTNMEIFAQDVTFSFSNVHFDAFLGAKLEPFGASLEINVLVHHGSLHTTLTDGQ